jgi:hypothetical protein
MGGTPGATTTDNASLGSSTSPGATTTGSTSTGSTGSLSGSDSATRRTDWGWLGLIGLLGLLGLRRRDTVVDVDRTGPATRVR